MPERERERERGVCVYVCARVISWRVEELFGLIGFFSSVLELLESTYLSGKLKS